MSEEASRAAPAATDRTLTPTFLCGTKPSLYHIERTMTAEEKAKLCARIADSRKAADIVVSYVRDLIYITDYFLVCTVTNRRQMKAISSEIRNELKKSDVMPFSAEGLDEGSWALLDYDDVVVHIFQPAQREYYALDMLWGDAPTVEWESNHA
ncbi:ribosome silencing factor [Planctomycetota bacterium]